MGETEVVIRCSATWPGDPAKSCMREQGHPGAHAARLKRPVPGSESIEVGWDDEDRGVTVSAPRLKNYAYPVYVPGSAIDSFLAGIGLLPVEKDSIHRVTIEPGEVIVKRFIRTEGGRRTVVEQTHVIPIRWGL